MEPVCTIAPPRPEAFMAFAAAWAAKNLPFRVISRKRSYSTSLDLEKRLRREDPGVVE
jgi:hypothetical protein